MPGAFGGTYDDVKEVSLSKVLFKLEALVYKVVNIAPDLCLGFLKGNLSLCRKIHDECGAKHDGEGSVKWSSPPGTFRNDDFTTTEINFLVMDRFFLSERGLTGFRL